MLHFIRKQTKTFAWFFVILLILVFALTSFTFNKHDQYAGEVFGKKVSFQEFRTFESIVRLMPPNELIAEDAQMQYQFVWQQVILAREAKSKGFEVSDTEVRARINQLVNPDGTKPISEDEYSQLLKSRRTTPAEFEAGIRETIRIQKMMTAHFASVLPVAVATAAPASASPVTSSTDAKTAPEAADPAAAAKKLQQQEYVRWMTEILQRANVVDYSKISKPPAS